MNPRRLELWVSQLLRSGVTVSGVLLFVGWLGMWSQGSSVAGRFNEYHSQSFLETIQWSLMTGDRSMLLAMAGLLILVSLPIVRVFLTAILFLLQRDFKMAAMAGSVFIALIASAFLGVLI